VRFPCTSAIFFYQASTRLLRLPHNRFLATPYTPAPTIIQAYDFISDEPMLRNVEHPISFFAEGLELSGVLHLPNHEPVAVVVGCHGLMADKNSPKQIELAHGCTAIGMAYFRFDHRGCGDSQGDFEIDTTLENRGCDLMAAVGAINRAFGKNMPIGLFGSSLGGTVCLSRVRSLSPFALVTLAAPVQNRSIHLPENSPESLKNEILKNRLTFNIATHMTSIHHILIIHGSSDETVPVDNAQTIYRMAGDPKKLMILEGGDHRISNIAHQKTFIKTAVRWFADCCKDL
ncbi:MAG: alpha/beta hydrolase, partial [Deltaproteobacteria bacterium]|nr:alpha/beta hydrolase [Deltaproteobacteria bacterium]